MIAPSPPRRILNISENSARCETMGRTLERAGYVSSVARRPDEALRSIEKELPDLVLLDADMPGVDSQRLCGQIRQKPRAAHLPVIFVSAAPQDTQSKARALDHGADGYLTWPADLEVLAATLKSVLRVCQAEARLCQSEEGFRTSFEQVAIGLGHLTLDGTWTWANRRLCQIVGYRLEELLQRTWLEVLSPEDRRAALERQRQLLAAEAESFVMEQLCRRKDGSVFWASWTLSVARASGGEAQHLVAVVDDISVRKRTEQNLLLIRAGIEGSSEAIAVTDTEGRHAYHNRAFVEMFGITAKELSEPLAQIALFTDQTRGREVFETIRRGQSWRGEVEMAAKDGRRFSVELRADAIRDEQGELIGLIAVHTDITQRKASERRLRQLSQAVEQTASTVLITDLQGNIEYANPRFVETTGYSFEEALGKNPRILKSGSTPRDAYAELWRTIKAGRTWRGEFHNQRKNGELYWEQATISPVIDEQGTISNFVAVKEDITERRAAREALKRSEERFRTLFERAPDSIYLIDLEGTFVDGNKAAEELAGYARSELIGKSFLTLNLLAPPDLLKAVESLRRNKQGEPTGPTELDLIRKDGRTVPVEIRTFPVGVGNQSLVLGVARDLTERKQLEGQLRQAQKMEAVGQLAAGVAHDFNNMLAVIRGNADLMLMDAGQWGALASEGLKNIIGASEKAANLTRQLLIFSRKQALRPQPLQLNDLIRNLVKMLERTIRKDIRLECVYADLLPCVQADPGMLEQVLLNLVVNARDAMPHGGHMQIATESLTLTAAHAAANPEARAGEFVGLNISDTGVGIAPEHLDRVFEPFFTTKEPGKGTGLGLATVYGIVKQHAGWIDLTSQPGGTRFRILLPAMTVSVPGAMVRESETPVRGGTERILLVEDDFAVRVLTERLLTGQGYRVWTAASAEEALDIWRAHASEIDLLLTDLVMPGTLSGRELAERLQSEKPLLKVIFASGYSPDIAGSNTDFIRRLKAHFLPKPCPSHLILQTVRSCLDADTRPKAGAPPDPQVNVP